MRAGAATGDPLDRNAGDELPTQILFSPKGAYHAGMKLKITITGSKVHDVGYRPYLTELAMRLALRGFEVYNDEEDGQQAVIVLVEGDEQRVHEVL